MELTNRQIIDAFVPRAPSDYTPERFQLGAFADQVIGYTGLLTRAASKGQSTNLNIPLWDGASTDPAAMDVLTVEIAPYLDLSGLDVDAEDAYFGSSSTRFQRRLTSQPDPVPVAIPQAYRPPGVYLVRYRVLIADSGVDNFSVPQLLVVDETSPYDRPRINPPEPSLPVGLVGPLDLAYIQSQPNQTALLPIPYDAQNGLSDGDYIEMFFGSSDKPYAFAPPNPETKFRVDPAVPLTLPLPASVVAAERRGNFSLRYRLFDVAGNPSELSYSLDLADLAQAPLPTEFSAPTVVLAVPGDGLIDRADVLSGGGVRVLVPSYTNALRPTDEIVVALSSTFASIQVTVPLGTTAFPVPALFTAANMDTLYGPQTPGKNRVPVTASYVVRRGAITHPTPPLETPFDLDLSIVGPVGPVIVGPGNLNPNLLPVVVQAMRAGGTFGPDNHLEVDDVNLAARARIPLWTTPALPAASLPFTVTLNYGGRLQAQNIVTLPASGFVDFTIPFSDIRALGGPTQLASYTITSAASANPSVSVNTTVIVDSVILRMEAPRVLNNTGTLNCDTLRPINSGRLIIHIPGSDYLSAGQLINVTFVGFQNNTQTPPSVVTESRTFTVPDATAANIGWDLTFDVSSTVLFNPINANRSLLTQGSATVTFDTQYLGQTVPSLPANYRVRGFRPGTGSSNYCAGGVVPA
ncbi:hypothetical protein [Pseudomonas sp. MF6747]|uniref:hypothetical protein n=1 Tax=Pseudomonas sp. MF6747 TaxID=2797527 RepID=UPI001F2ACC53|nr:hypothetical protein [Pseudomonas sp. MF6747]